MISSSLILFMCAVVEFIISYFLSGIVAELVIIFGFILLGFGWWIIYIESRKV